jgi:pimeloyl-ACP methyl ester carboxylesterase
MDVTLALPDGRRMMAADVGEPLGIPVLYVAGYGHCRLARHPDDGLAAAAGVRLLAIDPPGLGGSDRLAGYRLRSWSRDGIELADQLGLGRFAVLGWSWGGPYALALAHQYPDRVTSVGLVSALGGWLAGAGHTSQARAEYRNFASLCRLAPPLVKMFLARQRRAVLADPEAAQARDLAAAPPADQAVAARPGIAAMLRASQAEAWRQGTAGMFDHSCAVTLPWGFTPAQVSAPTAIWHGSADTEIFPGMAERLAQAIPHASLTMLPGEGHLLLFSHWADILHQLATQQATPPNATSPGWLTHRRRARQD